MTLAAAILLTTSQDLADALPAELDRQLADHPRETICRQSLGAWGLVVVCDNLEQCACLIASLPNIWSCWSNAPGCLPTASSRPAPFSSAPGVLRRSVIIWQAPTTHSPPVDQPATAAP